MKKLVIATAFLALTAGTSAIAADMPVKAKKAPPPPPAFSWAGCYIGIQGGGVWGRSKHVYTPAPPAPGIASGDLTPWFDISGGLAGGEWGCNNQFQGWAVGWEGDFSWSGKKGSSYETGPAGVFLNSTGYLDETREQWLSTTRLRVGPTWDRAWLYVTGGFAAARVEARVTPPGGITAYDSHILYGWTVGAGGEYAFWNNWSIKAEYLYVALYTQAYQFLGGGVLPRNGGVEIDNHVARVGLNWRFGALAAPPVVAKY